MPISWPASPPYGTKNPKPPAGVKQRIAAVMKWCIAQGFREDNPADDRITAALGTNTQRPQHMKALHHSQVDRCCSDCRSHRRSLGYRRRVQVSNPHRHPQRRGQKRDMGRNRSHHRGVDNPPRTHQDRTAASGAPQHRSLDCPPHRTPTHKRPQADLPLPHWTAA